MIISHNIHYATFARARPDLGRLRNDGNFDSNRQALSLI